MTSFLEKCLCWSIENGWTRTAKSLTFVGLVSPEAAYIAENMGEQQLSFSLFPLGKNVDEMVEKAVMSGDFRLVNFVCERYSFSDWDKALSFSLKHSKHGLAKIFVELGAKKDGHISEYCATKDPEFLVELLKEKEQQTFIWDSLLQ
ncbi:hypothetical protein B1750_gp224 [Noumeavirus]|uniref:Uncharacterized protein n=1 Tax=Marseillevirus sp. TaxID=2809551 RepID=A0AA96ESK1_9VIRU|nr:hypothetical protein B1750_gp224 [Noumeavirus]AQM73205.1 hypothetical protein NMV_224 [Noumeavirus]AQQ73679.1 hypothetical protein [Kurlavirus BKC-1]QZX43783.1 hypothetical protein MarQu_201 [Marseillevirus sp.]WNL50337.1 hypothetical protein MarDSR_298 [Marseillevirus sp.]